MRGVVAENQFDRETALGPERAAWISDTDQGDGLHLCGAQQPGKSCDQALHVMAARNVAERSKGTQISPEFGGRSIHELCKFKGIALGNCLAAEIFQNSTVSQ